MEPATMSEATPARRLATRAWRLLHTDAPASLAAAQRALARARTDADTLGEARARLALGFHALYFASPEEAAVELQAAAEGFAVGDDRAGEILAIAGQARSLWRRGHGDAAMALLLPLRDEGLALLRHEQRAVLLNAIAGCHSAQRNSEQAFAYMFEALRGAGPTRGHGFDAALHCNLSHELMELGDLDQALAQIERGLDRCQHLANARLEAVLRINRVIVLTELDRPGEAWPDVQRLLALGEAPGGRGTRALHFEALAIAAYRSGRNAEGDALLAQALPLQPTMLADERLDLAVAQALQAQHQGRLADAVALLRQAAAEPMAPTAGLRAQAQLAQALSLALEQAGDIAAALAQLRRWQALDAERSRLASRARYQAAALQTELLTMQHRLDESRARQQASERARAELAAANRALSQKIEEVQALQAALREQATQDALTGLGNRRHLNDSLPALVALARREAVPLAAVIVDLDHFKQVNDTHGHLAGDRLLAAFGRLLRRQLRASDLAFRYGGEEFCLLLPRTRADAAQAQVQRLLQAWAALAHAVDGGELTGQGFSAGVADTSDPRCATAQGLLQTADGALLRAKREGRRQVLRATA
jgi:diguanylate cyclase (GGDEF)-like protein